MPGTFGTLDFVSGKGLLGFRLLGIGVFGALRDWVMILTRLPRTFPLTIRPLLGDCRKYTGNPQKPL